MDNENRHKSRLILLIVIFVAYTIIATILTIVGMSLYKKSSDINEKNFNGRTSVLYIMEKLRQNDTLENIRVEIFDENQALVFTSEIAGEKFDNWIYLENGYLSETLISSKTNMITGIGQKIMPINSLKIEIVDEILNVKVLDDKGNEFNSCMYIGDVRG